MPIALIRASAPNILNFSLIMIQGL
jgi:hypothetical protein